MPGANFTNWVDDYASKLMEPEDAIALVRDGDTVSMPIGSITPRLCDALYVRGDSLNRVDLIACAPFYDPGWYEPGHPAFRVHIEIFNTVVARDAVNAGRADFTSTLFSRRWKPEDERGESTGHADVVLLGVSPPDRFGFCSLGVSLWNKRTYAKRARTVIAEMFPGYPRTGGTNQIHISELDAIVEGGTIPPRPAREAPPFPMPIAHYVNELIHDGDTIQVGTGAMTAQLAFAGAFDGKEDLGVHSEITVPGMNQLVMNGTITGARKTLHPNRFVATAFAAPTPEDIEFIHENPVYELYDVEYTNDIQVIAAHDNMVAINNAMTVDLFGQIGSESLATDLWSGPGGQFEYQVGAVLAKNGRAITILPSAAKDGSVTRIVARHPEGTIITVPRQFADIIVTEHGVAKLYGKSDRQRCEELISIAHPDHRAELRREAGRLLAE